MIHSFVYFRYDNPLESICYSYLSQAPNSQLSALSRRMTLINIIGPLKLVRNKIQWTISVSFSDRYRVPCWFIDSVTLTVPGEWWGREPELSWPSTQQLQCHAQCHDQVTSAWRGEFIRWNNDSGPGYATTSVATAASVVMTSDYYPRHKPQTRNSELTASLLSPLAMSETEIRVSELWSCLTTVCGEQLRMTRQYPGEHMMTWWQHPPWSAEGLRMLTVWSLVVTMSPMSLHTVVTAGVSLVSTDWVPA